MSKYLDWKVLLFWLLYTACIFWAFGAGSRGAFLGAVVGFWVVFVVTTRYLRLRREEQWKAEQAKREALRLWLTKYDSLDHGHESFPQEAREFVAAVREAIEQGEFILKDINLSEGKLWYLLAQADFLETRKTKDKLSHQRVCEIFEMINGWNAKGAYNPSYPFVSEGYEFMDGDIDEQQLSEDAKKLGLSCDELRDYYEQENRHLLAQAAWMKKIHEEDNPWKREKDERWQMMIEETPKKGFFSRIFLLFWK